jgi:hypothetical protein
MSTQTFQCGDRVRVRIGTRPYPGFEGEVLSLKNGFVEVDMANSANMQLPVLYHSGELELIAVAPAAPQEAKP